MRTSFEMALAYLKQGKMIRHASWSNWAICLKDGKTIVMFDYKGRWVDASERFGALSMSEILSNDWEVVE